MLIIIIIINTCVERLREWFQSPCWQSNPGRLVCNLLRITVIIITKPSLIIRLENRDIAEHRGDIDKCKITKCLSTYLAGELHEGRRIILECCFGKYGTCLNMWTTFNLTAGFCKHVNEPYGYINPHEFLTSWATTSSRPLYCSPPLGPLLTARCHFLRNTLRLLWSSSADMGARFLVPNDASRCVATGCSHSVFAIKDDLTEPLAL